MMVLPVTAHMLISGIGFPPTSLRPSNFPADIPVMIGGASENNNSKMSAVGSKKKNAKAQSAQPSEKRVRTITDTDDEEFNRVHAQYQETAERD